jgi:MoaA/NifB/PqqE/SkfB family radical SAM enzyme
LLRQNFAEILDQLNRHQFPKAVLATNGLLIDRQLEAINESALTQLTVSLDGMRSDHDVLRGVPGAFDRVVRNLRRVRKRVKIATLLTRRLLPHLDEFLRLCRDEGWDLEYSPLHKNGPPFYLSARVADNVDQLQPSADELDEMFERFEAYGFATPAVAASARHFARSRSLDFSHCINGYLSVLVYWNGDVRAGCLAFESIGNLADVSLPTLLASAGYRTDAERGFRMDCPRSCAGSSPSVAAAAPFRSLRYALARLH